MHFNGDLISKVIKILKLLQFLGHGETSWCFSQVKGALDDDVTDADADVISCVEFSHDGDLLATGDKGGRVVIFQVSFLFIPKIDSKKNNTDFLDNL